MRLRAFAKINLGLELLRKRVDGYHDLRTLFQTVSLFDEIECLPEQKELVIEGNDPSIPWDESNLIHRAGRLLRERTGTRKGARIRVTKNIPAGRGLAGGSSNAAVTLLALNKLWELGLAIADLEDLARSLGADVAFFLHGGLCLGEERGDVLQELPETGPFFCLLALPPYAVSTASIYAGTGLTLTSEDKVSKIMRFLATGDFGLLENDLEPIIFRAHPELEEFKRFFRREGAELTLVSGSGSAVYGLYLDRKRARKGLKKLRERSDALLVEPVPRESYWCQLDAGV